MKKKTLLLLTGLMIALTIAGCGGKKDDASSPETEAASGSTSDTITGYLIDDADKYVTLADFKDISVERPVYEISDADLQMEIDNELYNHITYTEVDRAAQTGDNMTIDLSCTVDGETEPAYEETDYSVSLGYEEFGPDFDNELVGLKKGDEKSFDCSFDEDYWADETWAGKTIHFKVTVKAVEEISVPEYDDEYVTSTLSYESKDAYEKELKESLEAAYAEQSDLEAGENAILAAMELCTFNGYPDKLYDTCKAAVINDYAAQAEMYGFEGDDIYAQYDITAEDVDAEALSNVNRRLFISAFCTKEGITVTHADYDDFLTQNYSYYGYDDAASFGEVIDKEYVIWDLYSTKAAQALLANAKVEEVVSSLYEYTDEDAFDEDEGIALDENGNVIDEEADEEADSEIVSDTPDAKTDSADSEEAVSEGSDELDGLETEQP